MDHPIEVRTVREDLLAAARRQTTHLRVSSEIQRLLEAPWAFIRANPDLRRGGHNVALYREGPAEISVEVGIQIVRPFAPTDDVVCSATPAGEVAATIHYGPYVALGAAHDAVRRWCDEQQRALAGVFWEIYGDWEDDPRKLRTDVLYLLA
jgi:effector-binding domain-containing protein